uniref:Uncharacterized protein n=1 Tax=Cacopsylla melanoneura TaxID=428564 RepID=A0A8D8WZ93_9HEMI
MASLTASDHRIRSDVAPSFSCGACYPVHHDLCHLHRHSNHTVACMRYILEVVNKQATTSRQALKHITNKIKPKTNQTTLIELSLSTLTHILTKPIQVAPKNNYTKIEEPLDILARYHSTRWKPLTELPTLLETSATMHPTPLHSKTTPGIIIPREPLHFLHLAL